MRVDTQRALLGIAALLWVTGWPISVLGPIGAVVGLGWGLALVTLAEAGS